MKTLRKGSTGEEVKLLQKALNLKADGIFGILTESAVKIFQASVNLDADGIVGPKTWNALEEKKLLPTSKQVDPSVIYSPLNVHISKLANRDIKYLAIHYTAGGNSKPGAALNVKRVFEKRNASADFCVDDRDMVQFNPDLRNYYCWAVGDKKNPYSGGGKLYGIASNRNTISIEMCSTLKPGTSSSAANHSGWSISEEVFNNTVKLSKILMKKFNIPLDRVVRHYDISGKTCPGVVGWNNSTLYNEKGESTKDKNNSKMWESFKEKLK